MLLCFFVYGLYNKKHDKIYIGQTENLEERVIAHNNGLFIDSFTSRFDGPWILIYQEECKSRTDALKREKQLKSYRGRQFIKSLIPR